MANPLDLSGSIGPDRLIPPGARVLVLLSGGADSVCLISALHQSIGAGLLGALHVNHGLRAAAAEDERFCEELCATLGIRFHVTRAQITGEPGNIEALARDARYAAAEAVRAAEGYDLIATGHTASDQVETVVYRLATSPGRRALLGIPERRGRIVRPLLAIDREATRRHCLDVGLRWREDESNLDTAFARNRIRHELIPALNEIHPAAERNIAATAAELRDEAALLEAAVERALDEIGVGGSPPSVEAARLMSLTPPLRRLVVRTLAERASGRPVSLGVVELERLERLSGEPGGSYLDLGGGVRVACEYGVIRFLTTAPAKRIEPVEWPVPGVARFGRWMLDCELAADPEAALASVRFPNEVVLDRSKLADRLEVRGRIDGDRMLPLGLGGSKSLQDLFTDGKIPRSLRDDLPVVISGGEIAWIAGVAVSESFKVDSTTDRAVLLRARIGP